MTDVEWIEGAGDAGIAAWLAARLDSALARGRAAICVPGGSTPFPILAELVSHPLEWSRLEVWPGDERLVPADDPASNIGRIRAILEPAGARCVALTEHALPPHFALTWLGMGADGHVASLFPSTDPQPRDKLKLRRITPDPLPPEAPYERLTLTLPALLDCEALMFVIRGADKRQVFEAAVRGESDLPVARLLAAARCPVTCFT